MWGYYRGDHRTRNEGRGAALKVECSVYILLLVRPPVSYKSCLELVRERCSKRNPEIECMQQGRDYLHKHTDDGMVVGIITDEECYRERHKCRISLYRNSSNTFY